MMRVKRNRCAGIAGRCARAGFCADHFRVTERRRHSIVFKRAGRIKPFILKMQTALFIPKNSAKLSFCCRSVCPSPMVTLNLSYRNPAVPETATRRKNRACCFRRPALGKIRKLFWRFYLVQLYWTSSKSPHWGHLKNDSLQPNSAPQSGFMHF